jgi:invasion protein IalB
MSFDLNSTPMRVALGVVALVLGLIVGWFGHRAWASPPNVPTTTIRIYADWRLACPNNSEDTSTCELRQDVLDDKTKSEIAQLSLIRVKGKNELYVTVPFNVLLEPGIALSLGSEKPRLYPYEVCNSVGCLVKVPVDDALINAIRNAPQARVLLAGLDGKPVGLPFSLKGFGDGVDAFDSAEATRRSWWRRFWS